VDVGGAARATRRDADGRHPLRDRLVKLDTTWTGVSIDTLLARLETEAEYVSAWCDDGYRTNLPLEDVTGGRAWIAYEFGGEPLDHEHDGPARLLVPHLYFWKSAK
jgi:DMSO/TMAO reductase YedYZ molybdopterin-dependent catalytic subunit